MQLASEAWDDDVSASTITACFRHSGIVGRRDPATGKPLKASLLFSSPGPDHNPDLAAANERLDANVEQLIDFHALSRANKMSLDRLLNPEGENDQLTEVFSVQELLSQSTHPVVDLAASNTSADSDSDDEMAVMTAHEAQQPLEAIRLLALQNRGSKVFRQLAALISSAARELRLEASNSLQQSSLDNWIHRSSN